MCPGVVGSLRKNSSRVTSCNTRSGNTGKFKQGDGEGTCDEKPDTYKKPMPGAACLTWRDRESILQDSDPLVQQQISPSGVGTGRTESIINRY